MSETDSVAGNNQPFDAIAQQAQAWPPASTAPADYAALPYAPGPPAGYSAALPIAFGPKPVTVRRAVGKTILLFAACVAVMQVLGGLLGGILAVASPGVLDLIRQQMADGGSVNMQDIMQNPVFTQALGPATLIGSIVGEALGICCFFFLRGKKLVTSDITTTVPVGRRWGRLGMAVLLVFAVQLVLGLLNGLISLTGYDPSNVQSTLLDPVTGSLWGMLAAVVLLPFFEELIFRGAILRHLAPYGVNFAIVTQAVLFGLWHLNLYQGLFAVPMGLILGYVAYHFSLKWSYALHALNNGYAMLMSASWMPGWVAPAILVAATLGALVVLVIYRGQIKPLVAEGAPVRQFPAATPVQGPTGQYAAPLSVGYVPPPPVAYSSPSVGGYGPPPLQPLTVAPRSLSAVEGPGPFEVPPVWASAGPSGTALALPGEAHPFRVGWASPAFIVVTAIMFVLCCLMMLIA